MKATLLMKHLRSETSMLRVANFGFAMFIDIFKEMR